MSANVVAGVVAAFILAAGAFAWTVYQDDTDPSSLVGGCEKYRVYAQNRWKPIGAAVRSEPFIEATKVDSFAPNESVIVDGWVRTKTAYPSNGPPWNSDKWFHLADDSGWVAFPAVRADPTSYDPTGYSEDGGRPAPAPDECSGSVR